MPMLNVDDPMLALITRFVAGGTEPDLPQEEFTRNQIAAIQRYVEMFPPQEREARALEWIEQYAERYRADWRERAVATRAASTRCADCPLQEPGGEAQCEIHVRWTALLERYVAREITSRGYVENALAILSAHKARLKRR